MEEWVNKIHFHAQLPPSLQLLSYDESQKVGIATIFRRTAQHSKLASRNHYYSCFRTKLPTAAEMAQIAIDNDASSSSRGSTPEMQRRRSNVSTAFRNSAADTHHKPISAPRSAPPPIPVRTTSSEGVTVALRKQLTGTCLTEINPP